MSKPIYKAQARPYTEDLNDLIEKGGVGSGVRGHTTQGPVTMDRNTGKMVPTAEYQRDVAKKLMTYSGFSDVGGSFLSKKQIASSIEKITGHSNATSFMIAQDLIKEGYIKQQGKVFMVMKNSKVEASQIDHKVVNEYVDKYQMKHPEGMGSAEARSWMAGTGMKPHEVDLAMTKIKTNKS